jgi:hypothetical protein
VLAASALSILASSAKDCSVSVSAALSIKRAGEVMEQWQIYRVAVLAAWSSVKCRELTFECQLSSKVMEQWWASLQGCRCRISVKHWHQASIQCSTFKLQVSTVERTGEWQVRCISSSMVQDSECYQNRAGVMTHFGKFVCHSQIEGCHQDICVVLLCNLASGIWLRVSNVPL